MRCQLTACITMHNANAISCKGRQQSELCKASCEADVLQRHQSTSDTQVNSHTISPSFMPSFEMCAEQIMCPRLITARGAGYSSHQPPSSNQCTTHGFGGASSHASRRCADSHREATCRHSARDTASAARRVTTLARSEHLQQP